MTDPVARRLHDGDERALEECYREHGPTVRAYVRRFVSHDDAEDVVQQVFFELWRSHKRFDPSRSLLGFILGIARNRAIDHLRKQRHVVVNVIELRELVGDDGRDLIDRLAWSSEVHRALATLPDAQRESLELSYFDDKTQREVAEELGVPLGTVKARMARGMQRLAEEIEKGELR
ncbi:MAG: sigma-70 family RNA polymerase sigma factor [Acidimicrobiales bacterium]